MEAREKRQKRAQSTRNKKPEPLFSLQDQRVAAGRQGKSKEQGRAGEGGGDPRPVKQIQQDHVQRDQGHHQGRVAAEETDDVFGRPPKIYPRGENGDAEQADHAQVLQQNPQGHPQP